MFFRRKTEKQVDPVEEATQKLAKVTLNSRDSQNGKPECVPRKRNNDFVGGFHPNVAPRQERNRLTKSPPTRREDASNAAYPGSHIEFPSAQTYYPPQAHAPVSMPTPYNDDPRQQSLTMQYALGQSPNLQSSAPSGPTLSPMRADIAPRPYSDSAIPTRPPFTDTRHEAPVTPPRSSVSTAQAPASVPSKVPLSQSSILNTPVTPRVHSVSSPPSPISGRSTSGSVTGGIKVQCSGRTQKGLRCRNQFMVPELAFESESDEDSRDEDNEPEFFCKVHESHVLSPKEIVIPQTGKKLTCSGK